MMSALWLRQQHRLILPSVVASGRIGRDPTPFLHGTQPQYPQQQLWWTLALQNLQVFGGGVGCVRGICRFSLAFPPLNPRSGAGRNNSRLGRMSSDAPAAAAVPPSVTPSNDGEGNAKTVNVVVRGKVQGVFYRDWTVDNAKKLGLDGWVRNLRDGSVEGVFSGDAAAVDSLVEKCHTGPPAAKVASVDTSGWTGEVNRGFERRPTG